MKKVFLTMIAIMLTSISAFAMPQTGNDGITYWNGDTNYPIWNSGSHFGSCVDMSSAVLKINDNSECVIALLDYSVGYEHDSMEPAGTVLFRENKMNGQIYSRIVGSKWGWQRFGPGSFSKVYYLVKRNLLS